MTKTPKPNAACIELAEMGDDRFLTAFNAAEKIGDTYKTRKAEADALEILFILQEHDDIEIENGMYVAGNGHGGTIRETHPIDIISWVDDDGYTRKPDFRHWSIELDQKWR